MRVIVRVSADEKSGVGHLMRCLALAQAWKDLGHEAIFLRSQGESIGQVTLDEDGLESHFLPVRQGTEDDARETAIVAEKIQASWVILDGYCFGENFQRVVKKSFSGRLMSIDDNGECAPFYSDLILNQNIHADLKLYSSCPKSSQLLLGVDYVLLRRRFRSHIREQRRIPKQARNLLFLCGGTNFGNLATIFLRALEDWQPLDCRVKMVTGSTKYFSDLQKLSECFRFDIKLFEGTDDMLEMMNWADLAVTASGSTVWEMAYLGLPAILVEVAQNQHYAMQTLISKRLFASLGNIRNLTSQNIVREIENLSGDLERRKMYSKAGQALIDGQGAIRVCRAILREE